MLCTGFPLRAFRSNYVSKGRVVFWCMEQVVKYELTKEREECGRLTEVDVGFPG
jgi:hypothetical protein